MVLYWGARSLKDLYMPELAGALAARSTRTSPTSRCSPIRFPATRGRGAPASSTRPCSTISPTSSGYQVYACGAPAMTDIARQTFVEQRGLPEDEFYCDAFTPSVDPKK